VSPERPEDDDFLEDDEHEEYGQRSIFATGWFRAVLVLLVLAVIAVIAVPLIGGWFEPTPPPKVTTTRPAEPTPAPLPAPTTPAPPAPRVETPATPPPTAQAPPPTPAPTPPPATPAPVTPPPAVSTPPARPEMPAQSTPSKAPEKAKAPERTAAATGKSASKAAAAGGSYWVQVGAFKESKNAEGLARTLRSEGFTVQVASVTRGEPLHVVRVGGFPDRGKATAAREELQGKGHSGFVTQGPAK
jgi:type IV secretory pathway VirB10-like protein